MPVMGPTCAKGGYKPDAQPATSTAHALNVVGRCRRSVSECNGHKRTNVHTEFKCGRTDESIELAFLEGCFALGTLLTWNLSTVFRNGEPSRWSARIEMNIVVVTLKQRRL